MFETGIMFLSLSSESEYWINLYIYQENIENWEFILLNFLFPENPVLNPGPGTFLASPADPDFSKIPVSSLTAPRDLLVTHDALMNLLSYKILFLEKCHDQ
jgi:hypothetical protein